jgi:hypothetical protein
MREMRDARSILVGKPEGKIPLGRSRHRREDNIRMNLGEIGWKVANWMHLILDKDH